jgi:methylated-DNA-[protein]-cysteine S-methyltransferase
MNKLRNAVEGKYLSLFSTAMGFGGVVGSEKGLLEVFLPFGGEDEAQMAARIKALYPYAAGENRMTAHAAELLRRYFVGEAVQFDLPIDWTGFTPFQTVVYRVVVQIPYGVVESYGKIAIRIGRPRGARGVGSAMARNPLPIVIPCHRVVGTSGALTGYSAPGGIMSKKWLLQLEGVVLGGAKNERQLEPE